uniref:T-lymphoma invasion and metastasis-inducing protein 1-like n=1 Tax=Oncorhynchus tshawytscha TaxID=74940 RepID=A0AAZ3S968_ONCTS
MGNVESQNGDHAFYGTQHGHLSRKHMSRSLRVSNKHHQSQSSKVDHRNSETSTRSSSTPSIPQSLVDHALEPFNQTNVLSDYSSPIWVDRVAMNLRPVSCHTHLDNPSETLHQDAESPGTRPHEPQGLQDRGLGLYSNTGEATYLQKTRDGPREPREVVSFKKKRSKSADMWREDDSLDFSLSDLSQEHLTRLEKSDLSREHLTRLEKSDLSREHLTRLEKSDLSRANSLDQLYGGQKTPTRRPAGRYAKWHHDANRSAREGDKMVSPEEEDDGNSYGAYTLPCRRSHCLSEGLTNPRAATCATMQGRRAQTIQDVTAGEGSEYEDSGIDGVTASGAEHQSRRCKTMSMSFSVCSAAGRSLFAGSDSGSSSGGGASEGVQGVYENFRQELEMSSCQTESLEEAGSALSDEQSTMSSAYQSDPLHGVVQGTVRKAGRLAVKNFLVHKKSKKVESATRRKWKSYWVCLKGCTLFFYETDGRSGIDHNSVPKHAAWAENSIVQAVPEHPKKDFVFCLSNSLGDAFLFQTCSQTELENWITAIHSACAAAVARQHHREDTVRLLRAEIKKLEQKIDMDEKMKKMGDMQLSAVTDTKKRKTILDQIFLWEQNLEQFHMGLFRFRCYLASLQGGELPNPKRLLAFASRPTKLAMGRLGIFSVSSFHALVAARTESGGRRRTQAMSRTSSSKRKSRFSSLWGLDTTSKRKTTVHPTINQVRKSHEGKSLPQVNSDSHMTDSDIWVPDHLTPSWVCLPNDQPVLAIIQPGESALYALETICKAHQLDSTKHYLRLKFLKDNQIQFYIPKPDEQLCDLSTEQVAAFCRSLHDMNPSECATTSSSPSLDSPFRPPATGTASRQLSDADKLRKVICELVETERTYVKDLNCLIGRYLTPLQKETCLTQDELDILVGNLPEMVEFQVEFLKTLEDGTRLVPDLEKLERVDQFKKILFSLGGSFLYYADRFKIYSAFCASHTKVPKVLVKAKTDADFKAFLEERNPKQQHSSTLESYLIKPIQRVLKYPLLLRELYSLTDPDSEEHYHLNVAMKAMNKVASHINEMQKIHEEFGLVFDQLIAEQSGDKKEVADLSMGDLLLHTSVAWINPPSSLGKWKKEPQLAAFSTAVCFSQGGSHRASSVSSEDKDPFRFRHMISTDTLQVRALNNQDGEGSAVCEIVHVKSESEGRPERTFHLCCSSVDSKKDFLKTVHSILRDKQRRQLMKTESLPPNQQYVPFGGKRLCALKGARPAMNRAASDPARTLGRRKLVRNRFTIDTDIVFDGEPDQEEGQGKERGEVQAGDTDRWVEEQIDLECYEAQQEKEVKGGGNVKEMEILSGDDDFCLSVRGPSTDSLSNTDLDGPIGALSLGEEGQERGSKHPQPQGAMGTTTPGMRLSRLGKQRGLAGMSVDDQGAGEEGEDIWLRRENCPPDSGGQTLQS